MDSRIALVRKRPEAAAESPELQPVPYVSLADRAYASVLERIQSGGLAFGDLVSRRTIARELEMSLPPVAEAFQRLEYEGLLECRPRVGTRVRIPSVEDVRGHYMVREALECQAARLFAAGASKAQRELLKEHGAKLDRILRSSRVDRVAYLKSHEQFHSRVPRATGSTAFAASYEKTQLPIWTWISCSVFWTNLRATSERRWKSSSHLELACALSKRDVGLAEAAMRYHVQSGLDLILEHLEPYLDRTKSNGFR